MKPKSKRIMGLFLALVMIIGCLPLNTIETYAAGGVTINERNFPDNIFRGYVQRNFDKNKDGILDDQELADVKSIDVGRPSITQDPEVLSLTGIENFKNLTSLYCRNNSISSLNISSNSKLEKLDCSENNINSLDVSKNTSLIELNCGDNQITSINISKNTNLKVFKCYNCEIDKIDLSSNEFLTHLIIGATNITSVDLGNAYASNAEYNEAMVICER